MQIVSCSISGRPIPLPAQLCSQCWVLCRLVDQEDIIYILTLGVTEQYRHLGVASHLIQKVIQYAESRLCRAVYLHVIDYNEAALSLYAANKFEVLATLRNFYHIE